MAFLSNRSSGNALSGLLFWLQLLGPLLSEASVVCGQRSMRIFGGSEAPRRKWPWQVSLQSYNRHICGGSLITNRLVLTAAHCVFGRQSEYTVMLGHNNLFEFDDNAVVIPVKDIVLHQYYNVRLLTNDIAIALLDVPVNYSSYIQPICLPERPFTVNAETLCWVTGWGRMEGNAQPKKLREAEQKILSQKICNEKYQRYFRTSITVVRHGMICGYYDAQRSPCWGFSCSCKLLGGFGKGHEEGDSSSGRVGAPKWLH
ncbi:serine protease 43-like [Callospermophilus lateralis]